MKKLLMMIMCLTLLVLQTVAVTALSVDEAKNNWKDAKQKSQELKEIHEDAKLEHAQENTPETQQAVVDTGKDLLHAALDEVEAWLIWKQVEIEDNDDVPQNLKDEILEDVKTNMEKLDALHDDVDNVKNGLELGLTFLKMIGQYFELVADVARNTGKVWVYVADAHEDKISEFEEKIRDAAGDNEDALELLDKARDELDTAEQNIDNAEDVYDEVSLPGTPVLKFAEGNNYLRAARANLIAAHKYVNMAYREVVRGGFE